MSNIDTCRGNPFQVFGVAGLGRSACSDCGKFLSQRTLNKNGGRCSKCFDVYFGKVGGYSLRYDQILYYHQLYREPTQQPTQHWDTDPSQQRHEARTGVIEATSAPSKVGKNRLESVYNIVQIQIVLLMFHFCLLVLILLFFLLSFPLHLSAVLLFVAHVIYCIFYLHLMIDQAVRSEFDDKVNEPTL